MSTHSSLSPAACRPSGAGPAATAVARLQSPALPTRADVEGELLPGTRVGDFEIIGRLGQGGMATVYAALHPLIYKRAAVKVLAARDDDAVARSLAEARVVSRVAHPNVVDVFDWGRLPDGRAYLVMELLRGRSLYQHMQDGTLTVPDKLDALAQLCDALGAVHAQSIVHRDLKPENVVLVQVSLRRRLLKLIDFGIAKVPPPEPEPSDLAGGGNACVTERGCTLGTPEYLAPEQARGQEVDYRTDLYALGVLAYELLCERLPYLGDSAADVIAMHLRAQPPAMRSLWPEVPAALEVLVHALLAKSPRQRPPLASLRRLLTDLLL